MIPFIVNFIIVSIVLFIVTIFFLHRALISGTETSIKRLDEEIAEATSKQEELNKKLKEADEELEKRQTEAKELANKMKSDAEEESKNEREQIVTKARQEGEEIIAKAQLAKEKIRTELEKELEMKTLDYCQQILTKILSEKAKGKLNDSLIDEFIESLQGIDSSRISSDINEVEVVSLKDLSSEDSGKISKVLAEKLGRQLNVKNTADQESGGGIALKFGSMVLDGTLKNLIKEEIVSLKEEADNK